MNTNLLTDFPKFIRQQNHFSLEAYRYNLTRVCNITSKNNINETDYHKNNFPRVLLQHTHGCSQFLPSCLLTQSLRGQEHSSFLDWPTQHTQLNRATAAYGKRRNYLSTRVGKFSHGKNYSHSTVPQGPAEHAS